MFVVVQGGESLFLYVTVFDGQLTHKSEVWVDIMNTTGLQDSRRPAPPKIPSNMGPQYRAPPPLPGSISSGKFRPPWLPGGFPSIPYRDVPNHQHSRPANRTTITARPPPAAAVASPSPSTEKPTRASSSAAPPTEGPSEADAEDNTQKNKVLQVSTTPTDDNPAMIQNLALSIISLVLVCTAFLVTAISACVFRNRICNSKKKSKKGDKVRSKFPFS